MADIFATGPTRTGYMSGASQRFAAPTIADTSASDQMALTLGHALGNIGIGASGINKSKPSSLEKFRLDREIAKQKAEADIADLASVSTLDDIQANYRKAIVAGARAGMGIDEVSKIFQGTGLAIGAESNMVGRMTTGGGYGPDQVFTPDAASALRNQKREFSLADQAAKIDEEKRQEGVISERDRVNEERRAGNNRSLENLRQTNREGIERLRDTLKGDRDKMKATKPAVSLQATDDLRKNVTAAIADKMGQLPTKEGDLDPGNAVDPGIIGDVMTRASELMDQPNGLSAMDAINKAIEETAQLGGPQNNMGGIDLGLLGLWGGKDVKGTVKKKAPDPLGIR